MQVSSWEWNAIPIPNDFSLYIHYKSCSSSSSYSSSSFYSLQLKSAGQTFTAFFLPLSGKGIEFSGG